MEGQQRLVQGDHSLSAGGRHGGKELMGPSLPDQAAHGAVCMHDLKGREPPAPLILHQLLGDHRPQHHGKLCPDLRLLLTGKGINDAVDGVGRSVGVQRGDHGVSRLRGGHGGADGFGFSVALNNAANLVRQDFVNTIRNELESVDLDEVSQDIFYEVY